MSESTQDARRAMQALLGAATDAPKTGAQQEPGEVVRRLGPFLSDARRARIEEVLDGRTYTVATAVEGLVNTGNVSAVMRSAEALGFQTFHVVTNHKPFKQSPRTTQGAEKWLDVHAWEDAEACAAALRAQGYRIVVAHLDESAVPIDTLDFTQPTALVFGNERDGITARMRALADAACIVPMAGFTRSLNISVAAAVCLYHARRDRLTRQGHHGDLSAAQREVLRARWYLLSVRHARKILARS